MHTIVDASMKNETPLPMIDREMSCRWKQGVSELVSNDVGRAEADRAEERRRSSERYDRVGGSGGWRLLCTIHT